MRIGGGLGWCPHSSRFPLRRICVTCDPPNLRRLRGRSWATRCMHQQCLRAHASTCQRLASRFQRHVGENLPGRWHRGCCLRGRHRHLGPNHQCWLPTSSPGRTRGMKLRQLLHLHLGRVHRYGLRRHSLAQSSHLHLESCVGQVDVLQHSRQCESIVPDMPLMEHPVPIHRLSHTACRRMWHRLPSLASCRRNRNLLQVCQDWGATRCCFLWVDATTLHRKDLWSQLQRASRLGRMPHLACHRHAPAQ